MRKQRHIVIIGASSGIGRALALHYGNDESIRLGLTARRTGELENLVPALRGGCELKHLDLASPERGAEFDEFLSRFPRIDLLIYSAGFGEINPGLEWKLCRETLEPNVTGFTEIINAAYRFMAARGGGQLAAISSVGGLRGAEDDSGYSAGKSYMLRYLEGLARKSNREKAGIRISTILPGFVDTAMAKGDGFFWMSSPETAASQIARGLHKRKRYLYVTRRWILIAWLLRMLPWQIYERI